MIISYYGTSHNIFVVMVNLLCIHLYTNLYYARSSPLLSALSTVGSKNEHYLYFLDPHTSKQRRKSSRMSARGDFTNVVNPSESGDTMDLNSEDDKRY